MQMHSYVYRYSKKVEKSDIDELNHVNNVVYVQWIQDAAVRHWNSIAPEDIKSRYVWVIVRHEIDYKFPAMLNEELQIETRVLSVATASSVRQVQIFRKSDKRLLVEAQTNWCMVDRETLRPVRISEEVKKLFLP